MSGKDSHSEHIKNSYNAIIRPETGKISEQTL